MSRSTARCTSILGLSALGLVLVGGPAVAAGPATQVPLPLPSEGPLGVLVEAVEPVIEQLPAPVQEPVEQVVATVESAAPAVPVPGSGPAPAPTSPPAPAGAPAPAQQPGKTGAGPAAQTPAAAASTPLFSDARNLRATSIGSGTAVLSAFSAAIGMGSGLGGFGTASALRFDGLAPQVLPPLTALPGAAAAPAPEVAPQAVTLAAGSESTGIPAGLPGLTVAAAAVAIAAAAAAHLAHAGRRRDIFA